LIDSNGLRATDGERFVMKTEDCDFSGEFT
jgi:hypothetical protein